MCVIMVKDDLEDQEGEGGGLLARIAPWLCIQKVQISGTTWIHMDL